MPSFADFHTVVAASSSLPWTIAGQYPGVDVSKPQSRPYFGTLTTVGSIVAGPLLGQLHVLVNKGELSSLMVKTKGKERTLSSRMLRIVGRIYNSKTNGQE